MASRGAAQDRRAREAERLTSLLRLAVAAASTSIYFIDPSEDPGRRPLAYAVLAAFVVYAAVIQTATRRGWSRPSRAAAPWIDIAFTTLLVAASEGTSSIFFPLYLFAILCAAFSGGAAAALPATAVSVVAFSVVGLLTAPRGSAFELDRSLIRPMYLGVLGYLIGYWGEHERRARRKLQLLREATALSNPRFGAERSLAAVLEAVRRFFEAESCRLVVAEPGGAAWTRVINRFAPAVSERTPLPAELAAALLPEPATAALLCASGRWRAERRARLEALADLEGDWGRAPEERGASRLAAMLEAAAFVSVPFRYAPLHAGRLYVTSSRPGGFDRDDAEFLWHVMEQVAPVLENVRVLDRLASEAAGEERRRVAGDLHDSLVQPYVGLRLGMASVRRSLEADRVEDARRDLDRLLELAEAEIGALRGTARALTGAAPAASAGPLLPALERLCRRFSESTGIRVGLQHSGGEAMPDRLAAEVLHLVGEALSNVRRHTAATSADVLLEVGRSAVHIAVENDRAQADGAASFSPGSISRRAATLGGVAAVAGGDGRTVVRIQIPL